MSKIVAVPILPHLKKFILAHYKLQEPVEVTMRSVLGNLTYSILISKRGVTKSNERYADTITLKFCDDLSNLETRISSLVQINNYYDKFFKDMMVTWVIAQDNVGITPYRSVQLFLEKYDITESEYQLTSAYRHWMRWKNEEYDRERRKKNSKAVLS